MGTMQTSLKRPSLSDEAISRFVDPRTGQRLRPLGVVGGRTVWPMMGASPDDPSDPDNEDEDKETKDKDTGSEGTDSSEGGSGSDKGDPQAKIVALEEEKNRHVRRRTEAERERDALKQELEEIRGKDKSEVEKMTERVTTLESENTSLKEALRSQRLENAFLSDNTYSWHNPGRALALADLSEVEIDEDGKGHGLKAALDKLAKSDAYLLKKESAEDDEEDLPNTKVTNKSKKDKTKDKAQDSALLQKYPALRR
jgi:hypothetical protein